MAEKKKKGRRAMTLSVSLPEEMWDVIDNNGEESRSTFIRNSLMESERYLSQLAKEEKCQSE